jgi:hypothetical protein
MASDRAKAILEATYAKGYDRGFREGQEMALATRRQTPRRQVASLLLRRLEDGPQPAELMLSLSLEVGCHVNTVRHAAKESGVFAVKRGDCWLWVHPKHAPPPVKITKTTSQLSFSA